MEKAKSPKVFLQSILDVIRAKKALPAPTKEIRTTSYSQQYVLRWRMIQEQITHDQTVLVNLDAVRLDSYHGRHMIFFCPLQSVEIVERIKEGNMNSLPTEVTLWDDCSKENNIIRIPGDTKPGLYKMKNVLLHSNGTIQVHATEKTVFEPLVF